MFRDELIRVFVYSVVQLLYVLSVNAIRMILLRGV